MHAVLDLDPAPVLLALEVARWPRALALPSREALVLALTALLGAEARGSTRLRVLGDRAPGDEARTGLRRLLAPLLAPPPGADAARGVDAEVDAAVARIQADLAAGAWAEVVGPASGDRPFVLDGEWLQTRALRVAEDALARALVAPAGGEPGEVNDDAAIDAALADVLDRAPGGLVLDRAQQGAVRASATARLTVIAGGPGTGKTSIVVALLRLFARLGLAPTDMALAAPTGKAAERLGDALATALAGVARPSFEDEALVLRPPAARTLHRLLGASPDGGFARGRESPLAARLVVVDEASMLDARLAARLVEALPPGGRLVLLGDPEQLPSVGAGAVLRDLLAARGVSVSRLATIHRVDATAPGGAALLSLARALRELPASGPFDAWPAPGAGQDDLDPSLVARAGEALRERVTARASAAELQHVGVEALLDDRPGPHLDALLDRWSLEREAALGEAARRTFVVGEDGPAEADRAALEAALRAVGAARLLTFTRVGRTGADALGRALHRRALARRGLDPYVSLAAGEPVIVTRNDAERGLWNGDLGIALWTSRSGADRPRLRVVLRRSGARRSAPGSDLVALDPELLGDRIELCHAMTVHKAQGSELDHAALVLPERDGPLVTRELLYTAVTRARRAVTIVGRADLLARAAARSIVRESGLADRLAEVSRRP